MSRTEEKAVMAKVSRVQDALGKGNCTALEITGNAFAPVYRRGDVIVINDTKPKPHDHVVVKLRNETKLAEFVHMDGHSLVLRRFTGSIPELFSVRRKEVRKIERVLAALRG